MSRKNLLSLLEDFLQFADDAAVVQRRGYRREKLTYAELLAQTVSWSHVLGEHGIGPGDRVLLWGPNSAEWVTCFWGILLRGAVAVPMDSSASHDFVQRATKDAGVKLVLRDRQLSELASAPPSIIINAFRCIAGAPKAASDVEAHPGYASNRNTIAEILYTSGTTAEPRGVVLTHGNFLANLEPLERGIDSYRKRELWFHPLRFVSVVPLSHVFGQFMSLFVPPLLGATVVFELSNNPSDIIRTIKKERATALIGVPRMLDALRNSVQREVEAQRWPGRFQRRFVAAKDRKFLCRAWMFRRIHQRFGWKFWAFISGGAALRSETEEFFKRMGFAVVQGYGMTETASLISLNHPFRATEGSIGKVLPGREFRLAGDGEILVRGENVSAGYWETGAPQEGKQDDGWLHTGDIGELDAEGNLHFRGRKKNVIVTPAGLNIYPEDLEAALQKQPGVRDCVVVPLERVGNAEPCAVLLLKEEDNEARATVENANGSLAEYQRMLHWVVWPELDFPRTPTGKPRLNVIAARAAELLGGASAPESNKSAVEDFLSKFSKADTPSMSHLERTLSLSSMDRVELMSALEQRFQVELNETSFADARTVADIERLLKEPSARRSEYAYPRWAQSEPVRWFRLVVYYALVWPATQILAHPKIVGREHLRGVRGPVLVISNHITRRADIGLILAALPWHLRHRLATAMGGETLQNMRRPPRNWLFLRRWAYQLGYWFVTALFNVFPLPQHSGYRESFRFAGESVDRSYSVLVFPEGEVNNSETGEMAPFQSGIGLLAENLHLPIVPMRINGVWQMKKERRRLAHRGEVVVRIGAPVTFTPGTPGGEIAQKLESLVRTL